MDKTCYCREFSKKRKVAPCLQRNISRALPPPRICRIHFLPFFPKCTITFDKLYCTASGMKVHVPSFSAPAIQPSLRRFLSCCYDRFFALGNAPSKKCLSAGVRSACPLLARPTGRGYRFAFRTCLLLKAWDWGSHASHSHHM